MDDELDTPDPEDEDEPCDVCGQLPGPRGCGCDDYDELEPA
jgi:hypothetical protein